MEKIYTIIMEIADGKAKMTRTNDGFNGLELLGVLEIARKEILLELEGEIHPDEIVRQFVKKDISEIEKTTPIDELLLGHKWGDISTRLRNALLRGFNNRDFKYINEITRFGDTGLCKYKNVGIGTWVEFIKLRGY